MGFETSKAFYDNPHADVVDYEARIDEILDRFPEELRDRYEDELAGELSKLSSREQYGYLSKKLAARLDAKRSSLYRETPKSVETLNIIPDAIEASIARSQESHDEALLGAGQTAEVLSSTRQEGICYKVFYSDPNQIGQNSLADEVDMQVLVSSLQEEIGVRIPEALSFIQNKHGIAIMMEKVDGYSLLEHSKGVPLPDNFNMEAFKKQITESVERMNDLGIYHRDLTPGNIMIGKDGEPWIIDFGRTKKTTKNDEEVYIERDPFELDKKYKLPKDHLFVRQTLRDFEKSVHDYSNH